ncbi:MAG: hypothetical protein K9J37_22050 [Saprospiraceae bacterium]|nr:hypothetical protein [Saprospiraceae bacterium]MCF8252605.1 hypothetical protein [Saprospiraceae bacterium]MCF8282686.1 hypothetical protein [Bacteroidales bacterium]MCF8314189.1 hypothetical protein [Saprospiraceae bacterium]MCF8442957.1 hypothetical protein [Saprospiraceae bacterium]
MNTIHTFRVEGIEEGAIDFAAFAGKKIMVVNVASECGISPLPITPTKVGGSNCKNCTRSLKIK